MSFNSLDTPATREDILDADGHLGVQFVAAAIDGEGDDDDMLEEAGMDHVDVLQHHAECPDCIGDLMEARASLETFMEILADDVGFLLSGETATGIKKNLQQRMAAAGLNEPYLELK